MEVKDDTTLQSFLDIHKEKGKKKLQEVATSERGNNKMINKPSAKGNFPLLCGINSYPNSINHQIPSRYDPKKFIV